MDDHTAREEREIDDAANSMPMGAHGRVTTKTVGERRCDSVINAQAPQMRGSHLQEPVKSNAATFHAWRRFYLHARR
ncbi:hypothetical protein [Caballeronia sp. HLA56]